MRGVSAPKARFLGCSPKADRRRGSRSGDRGEPRPKLPWKIDQFVLASPFRSWSLATVKRHFAQAQKAAPAGGPKGTKSGGSITPKSSGPIQTKSGGSNHPKSCTQDRADLLEILDDRVNIGSTLIASQLPVDTWHTYLGEPTLADAILDRLVHQSHRIELKVPGESMRKSRPPVEA